MREIWINTNSDREYEFDENIFPPETPQPAVYKNKITGKRIHVSTFEFPYPDLMDIMKKNCMERGIDICHL